MDPPDNRRTPDVWRPPPTTAGDDGIFCHALAPHSPQNFAAGSSAALQAGQLFFAAKFAPQASQNLPPWTRAPQAGQLTAAPALSASASFTARSASNLLAALAPACAASGAQSSHIPRFSFQQFSGHTQWPHAEHFFKKAISSATARSKAASCSLPRRPR